MTNVFVLTIINNVNNIARTKIIGHYSLLITRYSLLGIQTPIGMLFTLRHCNPVCAAEQKSLHFVGGMKSNPVCAVLGNAKCNQQIRYDPVQ